MQLNSQQFLHIQRLYTTQILSINDFHLAYIYICIYKVGLVFLGKSDISHPISGVRTASKKQWDKINATEHLPKKYSQASSDLSETFTIILDHNA